MEKCTYCIQRINRAKLDAQKDGDRPISDGEIVTACQAACPTQAIVFGDVSKTASEVSTRKASGRDYDLWISTLDGSEDFQGKPLAHIPGVVAVQVEGGPSAAWDRSVVYDDRWHPLPGKM